jgi:hypothetical protein
MSLNKMSDRLVGTYGVEDVKERMSIVEDILSENDDMLVDYYDEHYNPHINQTGFLSESTKVSKDLETLANYLLYAKDSEASDDTITDYRQKRNNAREASIDKIMKVRDFKKETNKSIIKVPKIKITKVDREEYSELRQSGKTIDNLSSMINTGKDSQGRELSSTEIRKLKWIRTDIQKDEIAMKNELKGYIRFQSITKPEPDLTALSHIRFDDKEIVRVLMEDYSELKEYSYEDTFGYLKVIMFVFEELVDMTDFPQYMRDIISWKVDGQSYDKMIETLRNDCDLKMTKPRLSKITRETIPSMIVDTYKQQKEDWVYTFILKGEYKTCSNCKENYLATNKYFSPDKKSKSGLRSVCKKCRKKKYQKSVFAKSE